MHSITSLRLSTIHVYSEFVVFFSLLSVARSFHCTFRNEIWLSAADCFEQQKHCDVAHISNKLVEIQVLFGKSFVQDKFPSELKVCVSCIGFRKTSCVLRTQHSTETENKNITTDSVWTCTFIQPPSICSSSVTRVQKPKKKKTVSNGKRNWWVFAGVVCRAYIPISFFLSFCVFFLISLKYSSLMVYL